MVQTDDLQPATRPRMNGQPETVQLYDCSQKIEAKAHAWRTSVRPVEATQHGLPLLTVDAGPGIGDAHDSFIPAVAPRSISRLSRHFALP
jgi:hypothetical protein